MVRAHDRDDRFCSITFFFFDTTSMNNEKGKKVLFFLFYTYTPILVNTPLVNSIALPPDSAYLPTNSSSVAAKSGGGW